MLRSHGVANFSLIQFIVYIHQCIEHSLFIEQRKLISFECQADRNTILEMPIDSGLTHRQRRTDSIRLWHCYLLSIQLSRSWGSPHSNGACQARGYWQFHRLAASVRPSGPFRCGTRTSVYSIIVIIASLVSGRKQRPMPAPLPSWSFWDAPEWGRH